MNKGWMQPFTTKDGRRFGFWASGGTGESLVKTPASPKVPKCWCGKYQGVGLRTHQSMVHKSGKMLEI